MNKISKICHFTSVHPACDVRIFEKECTSLAKAGYDVYLVATDTVDYIKNGVQILGVPVNGKGRRYRMFKLTEAVYRKALSINADIYHFHDPELIFKALKLKRKGKKVIFDSHEDIPLDIRSKKYLKPVLRKLFYYFYKLLEFYAFPKFDSVIAATPQVVHKLSIHNKNSYLITNYPIINHDKIDLDSKDKKFSLPTIFFAGGISERYSHEAIIKSFEKLNFDFNYILAGPVKNDYLNRLKKLKSWDKVKYLGKIPYSQVEDLYLKSHLGIALMEYAEASGGKQGDLANTKLFEVMMAGLPVLCTDLDIWREIVIENNCGLCIDPHDIDAIADAIEQLLTDSRKSEIMGKNGRHIVLERYNWNTQETTLLNLYKDLIGN